MRFDRFELDPDAFQLRRDERVVSLQRLPMELLVFLVQNRNRVVSREEIAERLWRGQPFHDTEHGINTAVRKIRSALRDNPDRPRFVETVKGKGYRFCAPILPDAAPQKGANADETGAAVPAAALAPAAPAVAPEEIRAPVARGRSRRSVWMAIGVAVLSITAATIMTVRPSVHRIAPAQVRSLVVLPFANLTDETSQDYLGDGLTEGVVSRLARLDSLAVISRTSAMTFRGSKKKLGEIARDLKVSAVLDGAVRRSGDRVSITAELFITDPGERSIWAESYEGPWTEASGVAEQTSGAIARAVAKKLVRDIGADISRAPKPESAEAYLRGRYFWNKRTEQGHRKAVEYFDQAIVIDPGYALPYAGLADCYLLLGESLAIPHDDAFPKARQAAETALRIQPTLAEAHATLAALNADEWNWAAADAGFRRAIELSPSYATAHQWYAEYLAVVGDLRTAILEIDKARELDPLSLIINTQSGWIRYLARRHEEAIAQLRKTTEMDPGFTMARADLGLAYDGAGRYGEALNEFEKYARVSNGSDAALWLARAYARAGQRAAAEKLLSAVLTGHRAGAPPPQLLALVYIAVGDMDKAFDWLWRGCRERSVGPLVSSPAYDEIRRDPRYAELVKCMKLSDVQSR